MCFTTSLLNSAAGHWSRRSYKGQKFWHLIKLGDVLGWSKSDGRNFESGLLSHSRACPTSHISPLICKKIDKRNHNSLSCTQDRTSKICM